MFGPQEQHLVFEQYYRSTDPLAKRKKGTGIGLTIVANALGFRTVIVIPVTQSQEKKDALRQLGAGGDVRRHGSGPTGVRERS